MVKICNLQGALDAVDTLADCVNQSCLDRLHSDGSWWVSHNFISAYEGAFHFFGLTDACVPQDAFWEAVQRKKAAIEAGE